MVQELQAAKQALRLSDALTKLDKYAVLIIDDIGYVTHQPWSPKGFPDQRRPAIPPVDRH